MSSLPAHDPLVALWQTAPKPDTHHLLQDLQRLNRLHQPLNRSIWAIVCGIAALVIMIVVGVILARSRRLQVQALSDKLRSIQALTRDHSGSAIRLIRRNHAQEIRVFVDSYG
jgi:hypothetical protein